jgi:phospholipase/lecithinase/hemolysin
MQHPTFRSTARPLSCKASRRRPLVAALTLGLALTTFASSSTTARAAYDSIVTFGTSLSDTGNGFALTGVNNVPPDYWVDEFLVPYVPYATGGHHLTNGATWIEQLARPLGLASAVQPALRSSSPKAMNFAVGTARARPDGTLFHLSMQVGAFLQKTGGAVSPDALYAIEMGSNDVRDAFGAALVGGAPNAILTAAVSAISGNITALYGLGAREFLVWNVPDIALTPAVRALDALNPGVGVLASGLTVTFNTMLENELATLRLLPGITIVELDVFSVIHAVAGSPETFGFSNVTDACITPTEPPFRCQQPDDYLFWDGVHPTHAAHAVVADAARIALGF